MTDDLVKRLRETTHMYQVDCELKMKCADRIEELEAENKKLRHMIIDQIEGAGDDPEIMAASRAEWAARAKAAEARIEELEAKLVKAVLFLDELRNEQCYDGYVLVELIKELTGGKDD
jgi:hypothetical protein